MTRVYVISVPKGDALIPEGWEGAAYATRFGAEQARKDLRARFKTGLGTVPTVNLVTYEVTP